MQETQMKFLNWQVGFNVINRFHIWKQQYEFETLVFLLSHQHHLIVGG